MSTVAYQVDIEAPVEHVWSFLDDETGLLLWMPEIIDTVPVEPAGRGEAGGHFEAGRLENAVQVQVEDQGQVEYQGQVEAGGSVEEACDDRIGARFRQTVRIGHRLRQLDGEITLYHPPWLLGLRLANEAVTVMLTFDVYPIGTGTRLDYRVDVMPRTWRAMLLGLFVRPLAARIMSRQLMNLKCLAEDSFVDEDAQWPVPVYVPSPDEPDEVERPIAAE